MRIVVHGGRALRGTFQPSGNSNSALLMIAAGLLTDAPVTLRRVPDTLSITTMLAAAQSVGSTLTRKGDTVQLQTSSLFTRDLDQQVAGEQVSVVSLLAPILARRRHARLEINYPLSRLYTHLTALRDLGINIRTTSGMIDFQAEPWNQRDITLVQTSVTATAITSMLAATLGQETVIRNAASEPHIQDLLHMLVTMGAQIEGIGSNVLRIFGTEQLSGADAVLSPDHIEIASIAAIGAITGGNLSIEGVNPAHLTMITRVFARLGVNLHLNGTTLFLPTHATLRIAQDEAELDLPIDTAPWPGFPSDLVAMATVVATQAQGTVLIHEKLFDNRLLFVDKLTAMGAQIVLCDPHRAIVVGPTRLIGEYLDTPDVRTGLALLGAALCADKRVTIDNAQLIERSFENVVSKLVALGAEIEVVQA